MGLTLHPCIRLRECDVSRYFLADAIDTLARPDKFPALSTRSTLPMSFMIRYALHRPESNSAPSADDRGLRAFGVGASCTRTPASLRKYLAPRASFVAVEPDRN